MPLRALEALERARDKSLAWVLGEIEKVEKEAEGKVVVANKEEGNERVEVVERVNEGGGKTGGKGDNDDETEASQNTEDAAEEYLQESGDESF
ncbi:hypothetical protein Q9189_007584 [Teloschistes chrysophthalmus]